MTIIAHRGWWRGDISQQNSPEAIAAALRMGWGVEFDVWGDCVGHDRAQAEDMPLDLIVPRLGVGTGPLLWNVKNEAAGGAIAAWFTSVPWLASRSWVFDVELAAPQLPARHGELPYLARASDRDEPLDRALAQSWAAGIWLDTFTTPWVTPAVIQRCTDAGKTPFIVSPELHGQPIDLAQWASWGDAAICTDLPHLLARLRAGGAEMVPTEAWW